MLRKSLHTRQGQALNEYALIIALLAVVVVVILGLTGVKVYNVYCTVAGAFGSDACELSCDFEFDDADALDDWQAWDFDQGKMSVSDGRLCNSGTSVNHFAGCAEGGFEGNGYDDFTANLEGIEVDKSNNGKWPGFDFIFRSDGEGNAYWFTYEAKNNNIKFWRQVNGTRHLIDSEPVPSEWVDEDLNFELNVEGNTFTVSRDGEELLQVTDDAYDSGVFGWRNKPGSTTCIDDIVIK